MKRNKTLNLAVLLLLCVFSSPVACQEKERRPSRYLIPEGFVGWVKVFYKVKDAPPLPIEEGYYIFKFPPSGVLKTSSDMEYGWATDGYFYYSGDVRRKLESTGWDGGGMIWAGYNGSGGTAVMGQSSTDIPEENKSFYSGFFVGTEAEYIDYGRYVSEEVGPINKQAIEQKRKKDN